MKASKGVKGTGVFETTILLEETQYILLDDLLDELPESAEYREDKRAAYPFLYITSFTLSTNPRTIHATFADDSQYTYTIEDHLTTRPDLAALCSNDELWESAVLIEDGFRILFSTDEQIRSYFTSHQPNQSTNTTSSSTEDNKEKWAHEPQDIKEIDGKKYIKKSRADEILSTQHELEERMKGALFITSEEIYSANPQTVV